jgi:CDP-diacylglycerol---serine O-phosphatidyltransferase
VKKKIAVLPTLLTLGNAVCGFVAITYASKIDRSGNSDELNNHYLLIGGCLILLAMVFDALDGYVARLSKSDSQFGGQLDSLSDVISFGAAPAFLLLCLGQLEWTEQDVLRQVFRIIAVLYLVCTVLRLARFNLENLIETPPNKRFKGLPSPGAAGCIAALAILRSQLPQLGTRTIGLDEQTVATILRVWTPLGGAMVAVLMVSRFSYPHLTKNLFRGRRNFAFVVQVILLVAILFLSPILAVFVIFWVYAFQTPIKSLVVWGIHRGKPISSSEASHTLN